VWGVGNDWARDPMGMLDSGADSFGRLFDAINERGSHPDESSVLGDTLSGMWTTVSHPFRSLGKARRRIVGWFEEQGQSAGSSLAPTARYDLDARNREALGQVAASGQAPIQRLRRIQNEGLRPIAINGGRLAGRASYGVAEGLAIGAISQGGLNLWNQFEAKTAGEFSSSSEAAEAWTRLNSLTSGEGYNVSPESWFGPAGHATIGRTATFLTDREAIESVLGSLPTTGSISITAPKASALEDALGLQTGSLCSGFRITRFPDVSGEAPSLPVGSFNQRFKGALRGLPGRGPEITIPPVPTRRAASLQQIIVDVR